MYPYQGLLGCYHRLEHGSRSYHLVHAASHGMEPQTRNSPEDSVFWDLRFGRIVSRKISMISRVAVVDRGLQGLCRRPDAHYYDRLGQRGRSNL